MLRPPRRPISSKLLSLRKSLRLRSDKLEILIFRAGRLLVDLTLTLYDEDVRRSIFRISQLLWDFDVTLTSVCVPLAVFVRSQYSNHTG